MRSELVFVALLGGACGTSPGRAEPEPMPPNVLKRMEEIDQRVRALETELQQARGRIDRTEQVVGLAPLKPAALKPGQGLRLELGRAKFVERVGGKPRVRGLDEYIGGQRGAVLALWATWCKPCIADEELVLLRRLQARLPDDIPLISMACDGLDKVQAHEKAARWIYPLWQVDDGHLALLPQDFIQKNGLGLPIFLIVDPDGTVRWYRNQALDGAAVAEILTAAEG